MNDALHSGAHDDGNIRVDHQGWAAQRWPEVQEAGKRQLAVAGVLLEVALCVIGLGALIGYLVQGFQGNGAAVQFSTALVPAWGGLVLCVFSCFVACFWAFSAVGTRSCHHILMLITCGLATAAGVVVFISFAANKGFEYALVWGLLWMLSGGIGLALSLLWMRSREAVVAAGHQLSVVQVAPKRCACLSACCKCACVALFVALMAFALGFTIQSAWTAADVGAYPPPGKIYTVTVKDVTVDMHLYCVGPTGKGLTLISEHGGGASSVSFRYIQTQLAARGHRFCAYDRVGYGWSPTMVQGMNITAVTSGDLLAELLSKAGESGPFMCLGHSAGAQACLMFVNTVGASAMKGLVFLDGYPDYVSAFSYGTKINLDPAKIQAMSRAMLFGVGAIGFVAGPTGFTHNVVGNPGPDFVPTDARGPFSALYGQSRFWMAQYWDLYSSGQAGLNSFAFRTIGGRVDADGYVRFDRLLTAGTPLLVLPAYTTAYPTATPCAECTSYLQQAQYYASDLSNNGTLIVGPKGSEHDFVYNGKYAPWIVSTIAQHLGL